jgi:hypothetical protein
VPKTVEQLENELITCRAEQARLQEEVAKKSARAELCLSKAELLIEPLRECAKASGYALAVHGSLMRDIDLIAAPWADSAVSADELAAKMIAVIDTVNGVAMIVNDEKAGATNYVRRTPEPKPHGRIGWSIHLGRGPYIDLSILPNREPTAAWWTLKHAELERQKAALEDSIVASVKERKQQAAQVSTLTAALRRYGRHEANCKTRRCVNCDQYEWLHDAAEDLDEVTCLQRGETFLAETTCTCGLDTALCAASEGAP